MSLIELPSLFYWYIGLQASYLIITQVFTNFVAHYAMITTNMSITNASYLSAIPSVTVRLIYIVYIVMNI